MRKKNIFILLTVLIIGTVGTIIYLLSSFSLFENNTQLLKEIKMKQGYTIKIYHIPSDATMQETIVIMKSHDGQESLIRKFERYDKIKEHNLINSDSLKLILYNSNLNKELTTTIVLPE